MSYVGTSFALLLTSAAAVFCVLVVVVTEWATCTVERRSHPHPLQRRGPDQVNLRPVFLDVDGDALVVDGLLDDGERPFGVPATLVMRVPESPYLVSATRHLLDRWTEDGTDIAVDLSRVDRQHPSVALSKGDSSVRLAFVRMSPSLRRRDL